MEEVLRAGRRKVHRVLVLGGRTPPESVRQLAQRSSVPLVEVERLEVASEHQGLAALVDPYPYASLDSLLQRAAQAKEPPLLLILDQIQDPQNLGTLLRTAESVGVHGVILPLRGAVGVTPAAVKASAGACEHLWIARENLAQAIQLLKRRNVWIAGLENSAEAERIDRVDLRPPLALAVGSEGKGLRRLVRDSCDYLVQIPMRGRVGSLNAAVAGSLALYEVWRRIGYQGEPLGQARDKPLDQARDRPAKEPPAREWPGEETIPSKDNLNDVIGQ